VPSPKFTVPGMSPDDASKVIDRLQERLVSLLDLQLTLKHIHWNVVGPTFIGVHKMLDPQVDAVRLMVDDLAERIATLGGEPNGLPGNLVRSRSWDDYSLGRADVLAHLGALDVAYHGVNRSHREAIEELDELDKVTQDILIEQAEQLEQFQWFVRAHLERDTGQLTTEGAQHEQEAAAKATADTRPTAAKGSAKTAPRAKASGNGKRSVTTSSRR
jgi:starvation-inducible DNA-binding protein